MILRELGENRFIDLVIPEYCLVFFEAKAPQPNPEVHSWHPSNQVLCPIIVEAEQGVQGKASAKAQLTMQGAWVSAVSTHETRLGGLRKGGFLAHRSLLKERR
jgi:hypothetical protein